MLMFGEAYKEKDVSMLCNKLERYDILSLRS
jgi:hypothetical protein